MKMPDPKEFSVLEGDLDGHRVVAIIREGLRSRKDTPWFLGFSTPLSNPTAEGLPTAQEAEDLNRWEDLLERNITSRCTSVFVGRVTWKGYRELLYYIDEPTHVVQEIEQLRNAHKLRPFAYRYECDPQWSNVAIYMR